MEIQYIRVGDYFIPDLELPEEPRPIGKWGRMRREYLKEQAQDRLEQMIDQMKAAEGVTEDLKDADPMDWVGAMNNIRNRAEEIILQELICGEDAT